MQPRFAMSDGLYGGVGGGMQGAGVAGTGLPVSSMHGMHGMHGGFGHPGHGGFAHGYGFGGHGVFQGGGMGAGANRGPGAGFGYAAGSDGGYGTAMEDCTLSRTMQQLYSAYRQFGTPGGTMIAQSQGGVGGVQVPGVGGAPPTIKFMSHAPLTAVVDGRHMASAGSDSMRTDGGLVRARTMGYVAAQVRPEEWLSTVSEGLVTPKGGEFIAAPPTYSTPFYSMNLQPVSACQVARQEQSQQLGILQAALLRKKLEQLGLQSAAMSAAIGV